MIMLFKSIKEELPISTLLYTKI